MRHREPAYESAGRLSAEQDNVPWYWKLIALTASWLILGGFLTLPAQFDSSPSLRISASVLSIFSVALISAGFALTALTSYAIRNPYFRLTSVFTPALSSCLLGLLTVLYCFVISSRYNWNTGALLTVLASALAATAYSILIFWTHRRIHLLKTNLPSHIPLTNTAYAGPLTPDQHPDLPPPAPLTEDELTRQQMLMLLLNKPEPLPLGAGTATGPGSSYRIDWTDPEGEDEDTRPLVQDARPQPQQVAWNGYYAPPPARLAPPSSGAMERAGPAEWANTNNGSGSRSSRVSSTMDREARRREIEMGF